MAGGTLIERVRQWAAKRPLALALADERARYDYGALVERADALAASLIRAGVTSDEAVAISLPPSCEAVIALLAIHAAGAAFFFVDRTRPHAATRELLDDVGVTRIVTADGLATLGRLGLSLVPSAAAAIELPVAGGDALAYVVASSGSTGKPKAVKVGHRGILPMLDAQIASFGVTPESRVLLGTALCFDASLSDIGTALASGASLFIPPCREDPKRLAELIEQSEVTHADLPPAMLRLIGSPPSSLETVVVGGEVVAAELLLRWAERTRVVVSYGPSEATVCTSLAVVDRGRWSAPSIGRPMPHVRYRLQPDEGAAAETDSEGELWIGGPALALGYANRPELERDRFVVVDGARWFRTGDRVRCGADGEWLFLGRIDRQRKVGGRIVCPEEIEAALARCGVTEASALVRPVTRSGLPARTTPVAFVTGVASNERARELGRALARQLPSSIWPRIERIEQLPRTASGKPDLAALERLPVGAASGQDRALGDVPGSSPKGPSRADRAKQVAHLIGRVLGLSDVGLDADFVELGGDSLAALELVAEAEMDGLHIGTDAVLSARTPHAIAASAGSTVLSTRAIEDRLAPYRAALKAAIGTGGGHEAPTPLGADAFFTGATGFFGSRLVSAWLGSGSGRAMCLVRAATVAEGGTRLEQAWSRASLPAMDLDRIDVCTGDIAVAHFGLDREAWRAVGERAGAVVHAAARLDVVAPLDEMLRINVGGALEAARMACTGPPKRFHLVSTLAVLLSAEGCPDGIDERCSLASIGALDGAYPASKWAAESLLQGAIELHVHRLGLLAGDRTGRPPSASGHFASFVRGIAVLGAVPEGAHTELRFDVTPVDTAARAVANLIRRDVGSRGAWHMSSRRGSSLADLVVAMRAEGVPVEIVPVERFVGLVRTALAPDVARACMALAHRVLGRSRRRDLDLFLLTGKELDGSRTAKASGVCITEPTVSDLRRQIRAVLDDGATR